MMPEWHQLIPMSRHVEESETAKKLQLYVTSMFQVYSFAHQLNHAPSFGKGYLHPYLQGTHEQKTKNKKKQNKKNPAK